jgi:hypothetical protein
MPKRALCISLAALAAPQIIPAATLKGIILLNEIGGPPLPNVEITTATGANPAATKSNGAFSLDFPAKTPGDTVQLIIRKTGYSVVNKYQLVVTLTSNPDDHLVTLLLCRTPDLEEMARRFYGLKSREAIEREYTERTRNATVERLQPLRIFSDG